MIYDLKAMQQACLCYTDPNYIPSNPLVYGHKVALDQRRAGQKPQPKSGGFGEFVILAIIVIAIAGAL